MSTYLYCFIAGAFASFTSEKDEVKNFRYPLSVLCRKSLAKYMKDQFEQWLYVSKCGIEFYEELFSTKYPWGKMDAAFVPDYAMGAMENVGLVTYNDLYV
jgi:aminopeptidase N